MTSSEGSIPASWLSKFVASWYPVTQWEPLFLIHLCYNVSVLRFVRTFGAQMLDKNLNSTQSFCILSCGHVTKSEKCPTHFREKHYMKYSYVTSKATKVKSHKSRVKSQKSWVISHTTTLLVQHTLEKSTTWNIHKSQVSWSQVLSHTSHESQVKRYELWVIHHVSHKTTLFVRHTLEKRIAQRVMKSWVRSHVRS